jgi:hypothetical protein
LFFSGISDRDNIILLILTDPDFTSSPYILFSSFVKELICETDIPKILHNSICVSPDNPSRSVERTNIKESGEFN